jgi:NTE family protein
MDDLPLADPGLAVSLSSAFLGFYTHAGFLQGLAEGGVWPGHLAGASSGALVAALAANGWTPKGILELLMTLRFRTAFMELGMLIGLPYLPIYERRYSGASKGKRALRYLKEVLGERRVENSGMDLGIAVTNLTQVRAEVRCEGPLAELIVASCAYPTLISHQVVGGDAMWDGGIAQSPPFAHWKGNAEVKRVLAHCVGEPVIPPVKRLGISDAFALAHDVIGEELYQLRLREMEREGKVVTRVVTRTRRPGLFVTERRGREFFENGRQRGMEAVAELRGVTR